MKFALVILAALAMAGCDGGAITRPDGTVSKTNEHKAKYGAEAFTLLCINGVEYMRFGNASATPKYNIDGTLVPCEFEK